MDLLILQAIGNAEFHGLGISHPIEQITHGTFQVKPGLSLSSSVPDSGIGVLICGAKQGVYRIYPPNVFYIIDSSWLAAEAAVLVWDDLPRLLGLFVSAM